MPEPAISVVIIGRNEGERLVRCLQSVQAMSHPGPIEIIYVDSNSSDGSPARAAEMGARVVEINSGKMSAARARNAGWTISSAPFILFLDGDTILHPDFVNRALAEFEKPNVMIVWGHRREIHPEASIYNRVLDMDWIYAPGLTEFCGGDALMRRSALEQAGGFNPDLIAGEEPDLCRRIRAAGGIIPHIDVPMTGHDLAITSWGQYWKRAVRAGHAYAEIAARYKNTGDPFWGATARANVIQAGVYMAAPVVAIAAAVLLHSWVILFLPVLAAAALALRSAFKFRWKSPSAFTLLLLGVHSHLQQIPVCIGQIRYWLNAKRNYSSELIEYKKTL
jgi:cellulose synthase/poly-beta-1,6-N-acetylglucosamine synthase-like glycosyltransferase